MRFLSSVFLLALPLVSGIHHNLQHVLDEYESVIQDHDHDMLMDHEMEQKQSMNTRNQMEIGMEMYAQHERLLHELQVAQGTLGGTTVDTEAEAIARGKIELKQREMVRMFMQLDAQTRQQGIFKWVSNLGDSNKDFKQPKSDIPTSFLMTDKHLLEATKHADVSGLVSVLIRFTESQIETIKGIHDEWAAQLAWLRPSHWNQGYEWNWERMWEPRSGRFRSYLPPVKSQRCGTCWAYSTSAMISAHLAIRYGIDRTPIQWFPETVDPISLSEGELFECTGKSGVDDVCYGNWIQNAAAQVKKDGIAQDLDYQFDKTLEANAHKCRLPTVCDVKKCSSTNVKNCNTWPQKCPAKSSKKRSDNPRFKISNLVTVTSPGASPWTGSASQPLQVEQIRDLLRTKGPLGFYFRVENGFGLDGKDVGPSDGSVYVKPCTGSGINHAMTLIGYGRTPSTHSPPNMDYWLVLNSWGNWSTDGIIKIQAGVNLCNMEQIVFYPQLPAADLTSGDPCTSQAGGLEGQLSCFRSICQNSIVEESQYCQHKGRENFCNRMKGRCEGKKACKDCQDCKNKAFWSRLGCWLTCDKHCKEECHAWNHFCKQVVPPVPHVVSAVESLNQQLASKTIFIGDRVDQLASNVKFKPINSLTEGGNGQTNTALA